MGGFIETVFPESNLPICKKSLKNIHTLLIYAKKKKYRKDNKKTKLIGYLWMEKGHKEGKRERNSREEKE